MFSTRVAIGAILAMSTSIWVPVNAEAAIEVETTTLTSPNPRDHDQFGAAVAVEGDTAVIGSPIFRGPTRGDVYVFVPTGTGSGPSCGRH